VAARQEHEALLNVVRAVQSETVALLANREQTRAAA
jgi:hypothetical protein